MEPNIILPIFVAIVFYAVLSKKFESAYITPPMVFTVLGFVLGPELLNLFQFEADKEFFIILGEITLVTVLFHDAAKIKVSKLLREKRLPLRMLGVGLPLAILFGFVVGLFTLTEFSMLEVALVASILAPTDAALGQAVITSKNLSLKVRQTINAESGLNDGLALPAVLFFVTLINAETTDVNLSYWFVFILQQVVLGVLVGISTGYIASKVINIAVSKKTIDPVFHQIAIISIAFIAYATAEFFHSNGFIAAFICGLTVGHVSKDSSESMFEFSETYGQFLTLVVFMLFGALLVPVAIENFSLAYLLYAIASLTIIRMGAIYLSLIGTEVNLQTKLFFGWFGPRGLASILFAFLIIDDLNKTQTTHLFSVVSLVVLLSIFLHGISAMPLSKRLKES